MDLKLSFREKTGSVNSTLQKQLSNKNNIWIATNSLRCVRGFNSRLFSIVYMLSQLINVNIIVLGDPHSTWTNTLLRLILYLLISVYEGYNVKKRTRRHHNMLRLTSSLSGM